MTLAPSARACCNSTMLFNLKLPHGPGPALKLLLCQRLEVQVTN